MSEPLVPNRLLFHVEFPLRYREPTKIDATLHGWDDMYRVPDYAAMDGVKSFATVWGAWNEEGLCVACRVEGRKSDFSCDPKRFRAGDNLRIMTDMRDTRDNKRASRFCQQFFMLPAGAGSDGRLPIAGGAKIQRATEHASVAPLDSIDIACRRTRDTYAMEACIPAELLSGFDPDEHRRIGFFYMLEDIALGQQYLTVGDDLYWFIDPSTWATAVLTK